MVVNKLVKELQDLQKAKDLLSEIRIYCTMYNTYEINLELRRKICDYFNSIDSE